MKNNWELKSLGEICEFYNGKAHEKFIDENGKYIVVNSKFISSDGKITKKTNSMLFPLFSGDIALVMSDVPNGQALSKCFLIDKDDIYSLNQRICAIRSKTFDKNFLYFQLNRNKYFLEFDNGENQTNLRKNDILNCPLLIPPIPEQKRIVAILDKAFAAIAKAKENAEKNLKNARELFESYLQKVFANPGDGWEEKTLGDVCSLYQGIAINAKTRHEKKKKSDLPLLRIKDLRNNTEEQYIDPNNYPVNALVNESDIIYTRTGNSLGLVFRGRKGVLHNNSFKIVPNSELDKDYLFIWLQNPIFKSKIFSLASKAAQPDITHAIFKSQKIVIPPLKEQKNIIQKHDALSSETKKLENIYQQKLADLEELKKSILQKAFEGEL